MAMFASIGDVCDRPIHYGRRSTVYISKQESECFALKASSEYAWKREMEVYRTLQSVPGNKFTRIQELLGSGELPVFFKSHNTLHKFYIMTRYNNLRDVKMWLTNIPGLSEAMRFKAAREVRFNIYKDISFYKMLRSQNGQMFSLFVDGLSGPFVQLTILVLDHFCLEQDGNHTCPQMIVRNFCFFFLIPSYSPLLIIDRF
ncbi:unnamed protein product [Meloidogyne enterolobii]|uniref:Uncharacterized protein n=1 Tax=Meloidogyne enterolobii TaxID=390850 RepID=A0ACB1ATC3_MELEN